MAQRDYAVRSNASRKKKKLGSMAKTTVFIIVAVVLLAFGGGLYFLKKTTPVVEKPVETAADPAPKSVLPSRPEEVWSYIKDLETREIPVDNSSSALEKNAQLTAEQKKILAMMEQDKIAQQKKAEEARKAATLKTEQELAEAPEKTKATVVENRNTQPKAEVKQEVAKVVTAKSAVAEQAKKETVKAEPTKQETAKQATQQTASGAKFGLQCGAFKNKEQADNLQARLALAGFNSRVASSAEWNRVFIGPIGDRPAASKTQSDVKSIANCVIIGM